MTLYLNNCREDFRKFNQILNIKPLFLIDFNSASYHKKVRSSQTYVSTVQIQRFEKYSLILKMKPNTNTVEYVIWTKRLIFPVRIIHWQRSGRIWFYHLISSVDVTPHYNDVINIPEKMFLKIHWLKSNISKPLGCPKRLVDIRFSVVCR